MLQKGEGIVIRTVDYGETHKIITLFTRDMGKIACMARGAKKPKSSLVAVSQLLTYGQYLIYAGHGMGTLRQGEVLESFREIQSDIYKAAYASYMVELLDRLTEDKQRNPFLFELLYQSLHDIEEGLDPEVLTFIFEMKMLDVAGIKPQVNGCVQCGDTEGLRAFSLREGGLLCMNCQHVDPYPLHITETTAKLLRLFLYMDLKRLGNISLKKETRKELKAVISAYYDEYSGLALKSKRFLEQLERMEADMS